MNISGRFDKRDRSRMWPRDNSKCQFFNSDKFRARREKRNEKAELSRERNHPFKKKLRLRRRARD